MHLVITNAMHCAPGCHQASASLRLPYLEQLLQRLETGPSDMGAASSWSTPDERVLGLAHGLPVDDGRIPWAAWQVRCSGRDPGAEAWAQVTPVHLDVGAAHISMGPVHQLQLGAEESQALLEAMRPYFAEDGITLEYLAPTQWLARGALFADMASASLGRVSGSDIDSWIPRSGQAASLRRLQNEMQMLLYAHPVNEARGARGLPLVNSFWVSGCGAAPVGTVAAAAAANAVCAVTELGQSALDGDWAAWSAAWRSIDAGHCARLLALVRAGAPARLSLCGDRGALNFGPRQRPRLARWAGRLRRPHLHALREQL